MNSHLFKTFGLKDAVIALPEISVKDRQLLPVLYKLKKYFKLPFIKEARVDYSLRR